MQPSGAHAALLAASAPAFAALGDPLRLLIVTRLCRDGPLPTVRLTEGSGITRQAVNKHLRTLEGAGLVRSDRAGRDRLWRVEPDRLTEIRGYLDRISAQWDARLVRLRAFVDGDA
jgi:DNA-binding transcriptional ArsR family regulator